MSNPRFVDSTLQPPGRSGGAPPREPVIVLAHHPVLARVGETLPLGRVTEISRLAPSLVGEDGRDAGPIDDPFVSRQPIAVRRLGDGGVEIASPGAGVASAAPRCRRAASTASPQPSWRAACRSCSRAASCCG